MWYHIKSVISHMISHITSCTTKTICNIICNITYDTIHHVMISYISVMSYVISHMISYEILWYLILMWWHMWYHMWHIGFSASFLQCMHFSPMQALRIECMTPKSVLQVILNQIGHGLQRSTWFCRSKSWSEWSWQPWQYKWSNLAILAAIFKSIPELIEA